MNRKEIKTSRTTRANNVPSIKAFIKLKREAENPSDIENWEQEQIKAFYKSVKVSRSAQKQVAAETIEKTRTHREETEEMEAIIGKVDKVRQELRSEINKRLTDMKTEMKEELRKIKKNGRQNQRYGKIKEES